MSRMHNVMVLVALVLAAVAVGAPSASATEPIQLVHQPSGVPCPSLASGGCERHVLGEATFRTHFFGVEAVEARCSLEMEGISDSTGQGRINSVTTTIGEHGEESCPTVAPPCTGSIPWPTAMEETGANAVEDHIDACIDPSEFTTCSGEFDATGVETTSGSLEVQHVNVTDNRIGSSFCEIDIDAEIEADVTHDGVHTRHQ